MMGSALISSWRKTMRSSVLACTLLFGAGHVSAGSIAIVEIANFTCPHCLRMESLSGEIAAAAVKSGGQFSFAPASWEGQSPSRDLVYFASRSQGPAVEKAVRTSLFRASQDNGLPLEDVSQVIAWLQQDLAEDVPINWNQLIQGANSDAVKMSVARTSKLISKSGVQTVPSFILLEDGEIKDTLETGPNNETPQALRNSVLGWVSSHSNNNNNNIK